MEKTQWYLGTPNGVVMCIDSLREGKMAGRLYHAYGQEVCTFSNIGEVIFWLEEFYDSLNFPHPTTNIRSFQGEERHTETRQERTKIMKDEELLSKHGDLGTFIIRVQHRQNNTWQGRITWMDRDKTVYFRSIWEMVKLVTSALDIVSGPDDSEDEPSWTDD